MSMQASLLLLKQDSLVSSICDHGDTHNQCDGHQNCIDWCGIHVERGMCNLVQSRLEEVKST